MKIGEQVRLYGGGEAVITYIGRYGLTVRDVDGVERGMTFNQVDWSATVERLELVVEGLEAAMSSLSRQSDTLEGIARDIVRVCDQVVKRGHYDTCSLSLSDQYSCDCPYDLAHEVAAETHQYLPERPAPPQDCSTRCKGECSGCEGDGGLSRKMSEVGRG